jgi:hypothetical protein
MDDQKTRLELGADVTFTAPTGATLTLTVDHLTRPVTSDGPVTAICTTDRETWDTITDHDCFHAEVLQPQAGFEPGREIDVRLLLRPSVARRLPDSGVEIADTFDDPEHRLCQTESWFLLGATQTFESAAGFDEQLGEEFAETFTGEVGVSTDWESVFGYGSDESVTESVESYFEEAGWEYEVVEEGLYQLVVALDDQRQWPVFVAPDDASGSCSLYAVFPDRIPAGRRGDAAALLAAHNYERHQGAFGLDPADGEVRFRLALLPEVESIDYALESTVDAMASVYDDLVGFVDDGGPTLVGDLPRDGDTGDGDTDGGGTSDGDTNDAHSNEIDSHGDAVGDSETTGDDTADGGGE